LTLPSGDAFSSVEWLGRQLPIKNQNLRENLVAVKQLETEAQGILDSAKDLDSKLQIFDKILIAYSEATALALNDVKSDEVCSFFFFLFF